MKRLALLLALVLLAAGCYLAPNPGANGPRWTYPDAPPLPGENDAAIRVTCTRSHYAKADPIVSPGVESMHEHVFFGNTGTNKDSTAESIATSGNSTCDGGTLNRTAYWVPAMYDVTRNNAVLDTAPIVDAIQVYYKSGYRGVHSATVENFPAGLRMVFGDPVADPSTAWWNCLDNPNAQSAIPHPTEVDYDWAGNPTPRTRFQHIPDHCQAGDLLQLVVEAPQCGAENPDGTPVLDSPNHRSHMAYATGWVPDPDPEQSTCPSTHPRTYAQVTEHIRWMIPIEGTPMVPQKAECVALGWTFDPYAANQFGDQANWPTATNENCPLWPHQVDVTDLELSSDAMMNPGGEPGSSAHADWFNGWDLPTFQRIVDGCFHDLRADCRVGLVPFPIGEAPIPNAPTLHGYDWAKLGSPTP